MVVIWMAAVLVLFEPIEALRDPIIPETLFYPFGVDVGDTMQRPGLDLASEVITDANFPFFNASHRRLYVNSNAVLSFNSQMVTYTPQAFPVSSRMITPYWSDIHTALNKGRIYYRQSRDPTLLDRATHDVRRAFSPRGLYFFRARWLFIATWHNVTYYGGSNTTAINSFQVVLITDEKHSFAMFNYGRLSWTTGIMSGGNPATGLGGIAAQVGFNAGDNVNFFALPGSRQPSVLEVAETTNVDLKGRWMFRIDSATIVAGSSCEPVTGECSVFQQFDVGTNSCLAVAPVFDCPTLEGPVVINRSWVELYCVIPTEETSDQAAFNVTFLFNGEPAPTVPSVVVRSPVLNATLNEKHLTNRLLGQWISCRVFSFWLNATDTDRSEALASTNSYWAGIEVSSHMLSVHEGDPRPAVLTLKSTIPITCNRLEDGVLDDSCNLTLKLTTSADILLRNRNGSECMITLTEEDWRSEERIEIFAKVDSFMTGPRWNILTIGIATLPNKIAADGLSYTNMWSRHRLPEIGVYHHDAPQGVCRSTGDPHVTTFDRRYYTIYATGQFTYVQTTRGTPIEVQLRHWQCGQAVSCVCGVAARENDVILVADMCKDSRLHFITYNDTLRKGAGIKTDDNGRVFEIKLPSKVKIVGYVNSWGITAEIYVTSSEYRRTEGLCGSLDSNPHNDLKVKGANGTMNYAVAPVNDVVESWRVPLGRSLFDGIVTNLPVGGDADAQDEDFSKYCSCLEGVSSCQRWMADKSFENGPNVGADKNVIPKIVGKSSAKNNGRRRRELSEEESMTDDIDWEYDSSAFNYTSPEPLQSPSNASNVTEEDARRHCRRVLWDESPVRTTCQSFVPMNDVDAIIDKCILDVQLTGNMSWADDKITEITNMCIFEAITVNITESNMTTGEITSIVQEIRAVSCLPQDCSGHGNCSNGTCICGRGYVGSDCALPEDAIPTIQRTLGPSSCDLNRFPCQKVDMVTKNVKSLPGFVCKVEVTKDDSSKHSFKTSASVVTMDTSSCKLPTDLLLRTNYSSASSSLEVDPVDFYSLPLGNSVLYYSISISSNGIRFSNTRPLKVYDSSCYSCDELRCYLKDDSCSINGYCFTRGQRNPFNPECDRCDPSASQRRWTKASDPSCNPCLSSPCSEGSVCQSSFKNKYRCIDEPTQQHDVATMVVVNVNILVAVSFAAIAICR